MEVERERGLGSSCKIEDRNVPRLSGRPKRRGAKSVCQGRVTGESSSGAPEGKSFWALQVLGLLSVGEGGARSVDLSESSSA